MSDDKSKILPGEEHLTEEERQRRRAERMGQDLARKYDPERLSKIVVDSAGKGEKLDQQTRSEMEKRLGGSFGEVRVFRGAFAEAVTRAHKADAVTVASTGMILVREGPRSDPKTALGKALMAHELTHVKQAQRGLHFALEGGAEQGAAHEREAEAVEAEVHAEETGQPPPARGRPAVDAVEMRRRVAARVLELIEEERRVHELKLGSDDGDG
jgi:hypothetical protein